MDERHEHAIFEYSAVGRGLESNGMTVISQLPLRGTRVLRINDVKRSRALTIKYKFQAAMASSGARSASTLVNIYPRSRS